MTKLHSFTLRQEDGGLVKGKEAGATNLEVDLLDQPNFSTPSRYIPNMSVGGSTPPAKTVMDMVPPKKVSQVETLAFATAIDADPPRSGLFMKNVP